MEDNLTNGSSVQHLILEKDCLIRFLIHDRSPQLWTVTVDGSWFKFMLRNVFYPE
jgi:hypothetical protein